MKQENLDELKNIYLGLVTGGEGPEVLNEAPKPFTATAPLNQGLTGLLGLPRIGPSKSEIQKMSQQGEAQRAKEKVDRAKNQRFDLGVVRTDKGYVANDSTVYDSEKSSQAVGLADKLNRESGLGKYKKIPVVKPELKKDPLAAAKARAEAESRNNSSGNNSSVNGSGGPPASTAPRPTPSGPVLSKKDGVEGTGVGADFKARAFTGAEKTRYSTVAAQNAARTSTSTGTSPKPVAPVGDKFGTTSSIKPLSSTEVKSSTPTTQFTKMPPTSPDNTSSSSSGETDRLKKALDIKKSDVNSSYEWSSVKTLKNIADAYSSVYEKKEYKTSRDKDEDGDNDFADNMIARMVASGMSREEAIKKVKNKDYNIGEATAMSKRGLDEPEIRKEIASKTKGGSFADKATALADRQTYGDNKKKEGREKLARKQRGDFRDTTSSNPGLHGYAYKATTDADKEKQAARGKQRGVLTPNEKKTLNREEVHLYDTIISHLLEYGFADTEEGANMIIENMSQSWIKQILSED